MAHPLIAPAAFPKPQDQKVVLTVKGPSVVPPTLNVKPVLPVSAPAPVVNPPTKKVDIPLPARQYSQVKPAVVKKAGMEVKAPVSDKRFQADPKYKPVVVVNKKPTKNKAAAGTVPTMKSSVPSIAPTGKGMNLVIVASTK